MQGKTLAYSGFPPFENNARIQRFPAKIAYSGFPPKHSHTAVSRQNRKNRYRQNRGRPFVHLQRARSETAKRHGGDLEHISSKGGKMPSKYANGRVYADDEARKYHMELAKTSASSCKRCENPIVKGDLRGIILGGPSPSYYHVACMEWSISEDNRKTCKGCPAKLTKGGDRIGCLQYDPWGHRNIEGYWHPACFQQSLKHFGSTLEIEGLRGALPALKAKHPRGEAAHRGGTPSAPRAQRFPFIASQVSSWRIFLEAQKCIYIYVYAENRVASRK